MDFEELNAKIPFAKGGEEKVLSMSPYDNITLLLPGRHALDTVPVGGDFCVCVTDPVFKKPDHQFTHADLFKVIEDKRNIQINPTKFLMEDYLRVVLGDEVPVPKNFTVTLMGDYIYKTMEEVTFLRTVQCLAVAEHRRYAKYENKWGGRYLPFRFAAGIAEGLWDASDATNLQRKGRPGVEILEKLKGVPQLTKELMG